MRTVLLFQALTDIQKSYRHLDSWSHLRRFRANCCKSSSYCKLWHVWGPSNQPYFDYSWRDSALFLEQLLLELLSQNLGYISFYISSSARVRPRQWVKNLLVYASALFSFQASAQIWLASTSALIGFCLISSAVYL